MLDVVSLQLFGGAADAFVACGGQRAFQKLAPMQRRDFLAADGAVKQSKLIHAALKADAGAFPSDAPRFLGCDGAVEIVATHIDLVELAIDQSAAKLVEFYTFGVIHGVDLAIWFNTQSWRTFRRRVKAL